MGGELSTAILNICRVLVLIGFPRSVSSFPSDILTALSPFDFVSRTLRNMEMCTFHSSIGILIYFSAEGTIAKLAFVNFVNYVVNEPVLLTLVKSTTPVGGCGPGGRWKVVTLDVFEASIAPCAFHFFYFKLA